MKLDRNMFSNYYLADEEGTLFGTIPYHQQDCGMINGRKLLYCTFSENLLNDKADGSAQESADMFTPWSDDLAMEPIDNLVLTDYAKLVVANDRLNGLDDDEIYIKRAFILSPQYLGSTFEAVKKLHEVEYITTVDDDGNEVRSPSHWARR